MTSALAAILILSISLFVGKTYAGSLHLTWQDNASNEASFEIERKLGTGAFTPLASVGADVESFTDTTVPMATLAVYRVRATNNAGVSAWSNEAAGQWTLAPVGSMPPLVLSSQEIPDPPPVVAKINFQPAGVPVPPGYFADTGAVYVASRGYGWSRDIRGNGRDRNVNLDQRLNTLVANSHDNSGAVATWRYDLPNGQYKISLASGDPGYAQGPQHITIESVVVVNNVTTLPNFFTTITDLLVNVADGHLDIQLGPSSANTVLNYVEIAQ